ncbi:hypothetical protein JW977_04150 [Candidatus Falkowbacteria bacterium]|nr:hypothetical protein [Candidatus Falkowbacteria bacterium]
MAQITVKIVHEFLDSYNLRPEMRKVFLAKLLGMATSENEVLTPQQLNIIFEGSESIRSAFEAKLKNNS